MEIPLSNDSGENTTSLYEIICWVRGHGEIEAVGRLWVRTLPLTAREGISFAQIGPSTQCSPQLQKAVLQEAALVVGKPYEK